MSRGCFRCIILYLLLQPTSILSPPRSYIIIPVVSITFNSPLSVQLHTRAATRYPPHFSEPWKLSDVVLVVEDQRFYVHRGVLAFWSPVFERMLTAEFKEKDSGEISLPEKKASEFEEMLQMMYPSLEEKLISQRNCYFLFELAYEYQIDSIAQKSVKLMVSMVKNRTEDDVLSMLIYAQKYAIKSLISTCIYEARRLTLKQLKKHGKRGQIEPENYTQIAEGIIQRLEGCKGHVPGETATSEFLPLQP